MLPPKLTLGQDPPNENAIPQLITRARAAFAAKQNHQAAQLLAQAESLAVQQKDFRQAAALRKALTILASAGKPRLLTRPQDR